MYVRMRYEHLFIAIKLNRNEKNYHQKKKFPKGKIIN